MSDSPGVLVTRAQPGAARTAARLTERGYAPVVAPLLSIAPIPFEADPAGAQALVFTSPNGVRAFVQCCSQGRGAPALCVGDATADAAREAGFADVRSAGGDADDLLAMAQETLSPEAGPVLWISGEHAATDVAAALAGAGFDAGRTVAYRAEPAHTLPEAAEHALREAQAVAVLFHSARAARAFTTLAAEEGLTRRAGALTAVCISPRVLDAAQEMDWRRAVAAKSPDEPALLDALDAALSSSRA